MDNELKQFQRKMAIAFTLSIALGITILFVLNLTINQRAEAMKAINGSHDRIEQRLASIENRLKDIQQKK